MLLRRKVLGRGRPEGALRGHQRRGGRLLGAFLSSLRIQGVEKAGQLTEDIVRRAMEYGNAAGGLTVQKKGAIPALPTREQIEAFLAS